MLLVPLSTDAPVYHPPRGTFLLIAINVSVYAIQLWTYLTGGSYEIFRPFYLHFGTINPLQWVTSFFLHAGIFHLLGNMIFLWIFGLIVEGKLGTVKFLAVYMLIGVSESFLGQVLMLWTSDGGALGASGAIFGLLAISFVWAPKNEIKVLIVFFLFPFIAEAIEVTVLTFCFYMLAWEFLAEVMLIGLSHGSQIMSSAFCHLAGAGIGAVIGVWMVRSRRVDCEGFDIFSVMTGKEGQRTLTLEQEAEQEKRKQERKEMLARERGKAIEFIQMYLDHKHPDMAVGRFKAWKNADPAAQWKPDQLVQVIKLYIQQQRWSEACNWLEVMARQIPEREIAARLKLAEIQILYDSRASNGLRILRAIPIDKLDQRQARVYQRLCTEAEDRMEDGDIELAESF